MSEKDPFAEDIFAEGNRLRAQREADKNRRIREEKYPGMSDEEVQVAMTKERIVVDAAGGATYEWLIQIEEELSTLPPRLSKEEFRQAIEQSFTTAQEKLRKYRDQLLERVERIKE